MEPKRARLRMKQGNYIVAGQWVPCRASHVACPTLEAATRISIMQTGRDIDGASARSRLRRVSVIMRLQ